VLLKDRTSERAIGRQGLTSISKAALSFLAAAIENADEERSDAWYVRDTGKGLRLMRGRLLACEVSRSKMRVSIIGPVADGAEVEADPGRIVGVGGLVGGS
jgi:hypothetical protein